MNDLILAEAATELRLDARLFVDSDRAFALAVADWLDHAASISVESADDVADPACECPYCKGMPFALAVARAYLGGAR